LPTGLSTKVLSRAVQKQSIAKRRREGRLTRMA
jgi:hypothetical protein